MSIFTILTSIFVALVELLFVSSYLTPQRLSVSIVAIFCSFITIYLQFKSKLTAARYFFFSLILGAIFINANFTFKGHAGEYEYIALPVLAILLFDKSVTHYITFLVSVALFYVPNYFLDIYQSSDFGHINTLFVFLAVFLFTLIFKNLNQKNEALLRTVNKRLEESKKNELAFLQLKSLRSQMNSHFIFNSLNSIQDLVLKQDIDASYDYITLFAQLVRDVLNYSNKDFIRMDEELDFLDIYLRLEKLRFGNDFTYEIYHENVEGLQLPSLIIQPFIENSLVHGLFHKSGSKHLSIHFEYTGILTCTIIDNGVGREKVKEIQQRQGRNHQKSYALEAIEQRLSILKTQSDAEIGYDISDLYKSQTPIGTKVVVKLPSIHEF
ncbi:sensor histidine kinase [Reichenbachiella versicolor]|uniref:sensor histidine kinase n=1 Tax=Reichenbachiella versicolor TaxID=1821036 RepID=UPI0013A563E2|nr:sensor histidine kinase [Reichenbachiella versicolor]